MLRDFFISQSWPKYNQMFLSIAHESKQSFHFTLKGLGLLCLSFWSACVMAVELPKTLRLDLQRPLGAPQMKAVIAEINPAKVTPVSPFPFVDEVRAAQRAIPAKDPLTTCVSTDGLMTRSTTTPPVSGPWGSVLPKPCCLYSRRMRDDRTHDDEHLEFDKKPVAERASWPASPSPGFKAAAKSASPNATSTASTRAMARTSLFTITNKAKGKTVVRDNLSEM